MSPCQTCQWNSRSLEKYILDFARVETHDSSARWLPMVSRARAAGLCLGAGGFSLSSFPSQPRRRHLGCMRRILMERQDLRVHHQGLSLDTIAHHLPNSCTALAKMLRHMQHDEKLAGMRPQRPVHLALYILPCTCQKGTRGKLTHQTLVAMQLEQEEALSTRWTQQSPKTSGRRWHSSPRAARS